MSILEFLDKTVEVIVLHGDNLVCRMIGTLISDEDGIRVQNRGLNKEEFSTNIVWLVEERCKVNRAQIPQITYNL